MNTDIYDYGTNYSNICIKKFLITLLLNLAVPGSVNKSDLFINSLNLKTFIRV